MSCDRNARTTSPLPDPTSDRTETNTPRPQTGSAWANLAACREQDAPSMFVDQWGVGPRARRLRAAALSCCRRCPVRPDCGLEALAEVDAGLCLYGVRCGIEFTDVTPSRQQRDIARLRALVAKLLRAASLRTAPELS